MSEDQQQPAPEQQPTPDAAPAPDSAPKGDPPPWGEDFDPEKAWKLIQNLKGDKEKLSGKLKEAEPALAEAEKIRQANQSEADKTAERLAEAERNNEQNTELVGRFRDRAVKAEAKAIAAPQFQDADDAVQLLGGLDKYVSDDGDIDTDKLSSDLNGLLERKPYLARSDDGSRRMRPNPAQGQSGNPPLTSAQRAREAETSGNFKAAQQIKADQLLALKHEQ